MYGRLGRLERAKSSFMKAIEISPRDEKLYYNAGSTSYKTAFSLLFLTPQNSFDFAGFLR